MPDASVVHLCIAARAGEPVRLVDEVRAVPGHGIDGDRYFDGDGTFAKKGDGSGEITLIESEALEALRRDDGVELAPHESRRNVVTRGVALNHLFGREFTVGAVRLAGLGLCEPCGHLEKLTRAGVRQGLLHRGGLRARILSEGRIRVGDPIRS